MEHETTTQQSSTTATIYQLHRGNQREDPDAMAAEEIRFEVRGDGRSALSEAEFSRFYQEVGTESFSHSKVESIQRSVWARWNRGSGEESVSFIEAETRSLEVGDVIEVAGDYYMIAPFEWAEIAVGNEEQE
ncbi:hypothetical protein HLRTI_002902 [Halorhabdus tiamatea SARL4B]|uniref:Uncharacterized protein n=1 Tax=Halorhabdus tiamatea SARL4B TaxID=1033806 RepID=U2DY53_9EURY|nr:hypothetical protein [Halorhabdus tiamatea]ERJ05103.1 hypothetical protein HLRTI_002902 [Halorhabdus tiamatea SARL4B]